VRSRPSDRTPLDRPGRAEVAARRAQLGRPRLFVRLEVRDRVDESARGGTTLSHIRSKIAAYTTASGVRPVASACGSSSGKRSRIDSSLSKTLRNTSSSIAFRSARRRTSCACATRATPRGDHRASRPNRPAPPAAPLRVHGCRAHVINQFRRLFGCGYGRTRTYALTLQTSTGSGV